MYLGQRGCQCPQCKSTDVQYHLDDELNEWYECIHCEEKGDKYDFTCTELTEKECSTNT